MKRAALITTDAPVTDAYGEPNLFWCVVGPGSPDDWDHQPLEPSPHLLADLREAASACALVAATSSGPRAQHWDDLAARVRALLPEEDGHA